MKVFNKTPKLQKILMPLIVPFLCGLIGAAIGVYVTRSKLETQNERISNFYEDEMSTIVSPTTLKKWIDDKDTNYMLVDLRSAAEYDAEHFVTAINIPAVSMTTNQIVAAFKTLPKNKEIVIHCYSSYCTLGRQVGQTLAEHGIFVHELDAGWSELRFHWDLWNPGAGINDGASYIVKGSPAPSPKPGTISPCVAGQYGC